MKRYIARKYITARDYDDAYRQVKNFKPDELWLDEKQPEEPAPKDQIGFELPSSEYYYSPYLKKSKKKKR